MSKGKRKLNLPSSLSSSLVFAFRCFQFNPALCVGGRFLWMLPRWSPGTAAIVAKAAALWLQWAQAMLHLFLQLQPSILRACPDNSFSRSPVLISGPRNLKCSSWFYATTVFIIILN